MFEEAPSHPHLTAGVEMPYDIRFAALVLDWASGIMELSGGNQREIDGLRLALDETLTYLISSYDEAESWELIRVQALLTQDGVAEFTISNAGPPVHLDRIPEYDPTNVDQADTDGLWFFLAKKMVDSLEFQNCGMEGWQVSIKQGLAAPSFETNTPNENVSNKPSRLAFTSRLGLPDDASQLMDLTYDTYRYSYPGEEYYHQSKLRKALAGDNFAALLVENDGNIIAHSAISIPEGAPHCGYLGSLMVRRAFRGTRAIITIIKDTIRYIEENPLGVDLYYGTMVTEHAASQKAGAKVGLHPLALLLSVGSAVDYRGMHLEKAQRESFVLCARLVRTPEIETLFLPGRHHEVMRPLLDRVGCSTQMAWDGKWLPEQSTVLLTDEDRTELNGYITIQSMGEDWENQLRKSMFDMRARGLRTVIILVPAWRQPPLDLEKRMTRLNSIFTGIKPVSASEYHLVYCAVSDHVDFNRIQLADPNAEALKEHVSQLCREALDG